MQDRRIGTFTLGMCLLVFGVLFLVHLFFPVINYTMIFHVWPIIFILLGGEILYFSTTAPKKHFHYDFAAILIIFLLSCFAMGMAGVEWILKYYSEYIHI